MIQQTGRVEKIVNIQTLTLRQEKQFLSPAQTTEQLALLDSQTYCLSKPVVTGSI